MRPISIFTILFCLSGLFYSCSQDPCEDSACLNGGTCMDGSCQCPENYTGKNCQQEVPPDEIRVTAISVNRFPAFNGDAQWDGVDGPDIYYKISEPEHPLAQPELPIENANAAIVNNFYFIPFNFRYVSSVHKIELFDYDGIGIPSDKLGEVEFTPYQSGSGFPKTLIIDNGGSVAFTMTIEYIYNHFDD